MTWDIKTAKHEDAWLQEYIQDVLSLAPTVRPDQGQRIGATRVTWWEVVPGRAVIHCAGGSLVDRTLAEIVLRQELASVGIEQVGFDIDDPGLRKVANWNDIMAKAKRLIQAGNVTVLRNGYNNLVGHVIGDHGEYNVEISRDDPDSRVITQWTCECPWDQYAWGRTRQFKRFEGRPCSHVMALLWKAQATPLDGDVPDGYQPTPGQAGPEGGPGQIPMGDAEFGANPSFGPDHLYDQQQGLSPTSPSPQGQPMLPQAPTPDQGVIPPNPMEQMELAMQPPPPPGTSPPGVPAPPNSVSVPGARLPTPFNPVQYPGGTYSKVAAEQAFEPYQLVRLKAEDWGVSEGKSADHGAGQYTLIPRNSVGTVLHQDPSTGWVECIFAGPADSNGRMEPYHVRGFYSPDQLMPAPDAQPPGPWGPSRKR